MAGIDRAAQPSSALSLYAKRERSQSCPLGASNILSHNQDAVHGEDEKQAGVSLPVNVEIVFSCGLKPPSRSVWKTLEDWDWDGITDTGGHVEGSRKEAWKMGTKKEGRQACANLV